LAELFVATIIGQFLLFPFSATGQQSRVPGCSNDIATSTKTVKYGELEKTGTKSSGMYSISMPVAVRYCHKPG
jgi:hypothetical protein